jgi:hypothetical protein
VEPLPLASLSEVTTFPSVAFNLGWE